MHYIKYNIILHKILSKYYIFTIWNLDIPYTYIYRHPLNLHTCEV